MPFAIKYYRQKKYEWKPGSKGRSAMQTTKRLWIGDTIFLVGVGALAWFVVGLKTGWSYAEEKEDIKLRRKPKLDKIPA